MSKLPICPKRTNEGRCCYHTASSAWKPGEVVSQEYCCWCDRQKESVQKLETLPEIPHGPHLKSKNLDAQDEGTVKYKAKSLPIEAVQYQGSNFTEVYDLAEVRPFYRQTEPQVPLTIVYRGGHAVLEPGDWVVMDFHGTVSAWDDSEFHRLYEKAGYQPGAYTE